MSVGPRGMQGQRREREMWSDGHKIASTIRDCCQFSLLLDTIRLHLSSILLCGSCRNSYWVFITLSSLQCVCLFSPGSTLNRKKDFVYRLVWDTRFDLCSLSPKHEERSFSLILSLDASILLSLAQWSIITVNLHHRMILELLGRTHTERERERSKNLPEWLSREKSNERATRWRKWRRRVRMLNK